MSAGEAAGQAQGDGGGEAAEVQQQGPDVGQLADQLGGLTQDMGQLREMLPQLQEFIQGQQQPAAEEQAPEEPLNLDFLDTGDPEYNAQLATGLQSLIRSEAEKIARAQTTEAVSPLMEKVTAYEADRLSDEYPELKEPETAQRVVQFARLRAEALGHPELADNVDFWRESYLLGRAMQMLEEEQQAGQEPAAHLEGAGGANAGAAPQVDLGDQIVNGPEGARLGAKVLPWH